MKPRIKSTSDRYSLDKIRSQIGSNFNLVASQFEDVKLLVFTEDKDDYKILKDISIKLGINISSFNIPIHGFSRRQDSLAYLDAYKLLIGKEVKASLYLDRDYYPDEYLDEIKVKLGAKGIHVIFTIGKEIENMFISPIIMDNIIPDEYKNDFERFMDIQYSRSMGSCLGNFISLHKEFLPTKLDIKTITEQYYPYFNSKWDDNKERHLFINGKETLTCIIHKHRFLW